MRAVLFLLFIGLGMAGAAITTAGLSISVVFQVALILTLTAISLLTLAMVVTVEPREGGAS